MIPGMLIPILLEVLGMALAAGGNILGPLCFIPLPGWPSLSLAPGSCFSKATRRDQAPADAGQQQIYPATEAPRYWAYLSWRRGGQRCVKLGTGLEFITRDG